MDFLQKEPTPSVSLQKAWGWVVFGLVFVGILVVGTIAYAKTYQNKVLPGVYLGEIYVGGMDRSDLQEFLHNMDDKLSKQGLDFSFEDGEKHEQFTIYPSIVANENIVDIVSIDIQLEVDRLLGYGKTGNIFKRAWQTGTSRVWRPHLKVQNIEIDEETLLTSIQDKVFVNKFWQDGLN